jgi:hypothetical protein
MSHWKVVVGSTVTASPRRRRALRRRHHTSRPGSASGDGGLAPIVRRRPARLTRPAHRSHGMCASLCYDELFGASPQTRSAPPAPPIDRR